MTYKFNWAAEKADIPYSIDSKSFDFNRVKNQSFKLEEQRSTRGKGARDKIRKNN